MSDDQKDYEYEDEAEEEVEEIEATDSNGIANCLITMGALLSVIIAAAGGILSLSSENATPSKYLSLWQYTEIGDFREDLEWTLDLDPETCWRASDFEYGAKVRIGLGYTDTSITKVNRIEILTHKSEPQDGFEIFLCIEKKCWFECETLEPGDNSFSWHFEYFSWQISYCGDMPAEYIKIEPTGQNQLLGFCEFKVYGIETYA
ncbi:uncharacterized protein LOC142354396 isoform X2 [Convolutriloba macropyga]|uniref:uncharacterized protein LOC142354396 isoform X2 n=1 Tax=Convolutriloba macropyga TaxID=536237 RepID=UPI003F524327